MQKPCNDCPFRLDVTPYLSERKKAEITQALMGDSAFHCHKTIDYSNYWGGEITDKSKLCMGAAKFLENVRSGGLRANLAFRLALMLGHLNLETIQNCDVEIYADINEFLES